MRYTAIAQLGVPIDHCTLTEAVERIAEFVDEGRRTGRTHQVVTVNADFLRHAIEAEDVHAILRGADLAVADGMPIVWASAGLGQRVPARVTGPDLLLGLAELAAYRGKRILLLGGAADTASTTAEILRGRWDSLIVHSLTGEIGATGDTSSDLLDEILAFGPDLAFIALGHPKQERWIRRHGEALGIPVAIGVGATFDYISLRRRRAPVAVQDMGLEWLYRLAQEPTRLTRRYLTDFVHYLPGVGAQIRRTRSASRTHRSRGGTMGAIEVTETVDSVLVELMNIDRLGHEHVGELSTIARSAQASRRELVLSTTSGQVLRDLHRIRLDRLFRIVPPEHRTTR